MHIWQQYENSSLSNASNMNNNIKMTLFLMLQIWMNKNGSSFSNMNEAIFSAPTGHGNMFVDF